MERSVHGTALRRCSHETSAYTNSAESKAIAKSGSMHEVKATRIKNNKRVT